MSAMVKPMGQRIDFLQASIETHLALPAHHGAVDKLARITEKFVEVETQFAGAREKHADYAKTTDRRLAIIESGLQTATITYVAHEERLRTVEQR